MKDFAAIDFETANNERTSVCSVGVVIVRDGEIVDTSDTAGAELLQLLVYAGAWPDASRYGGGSSVSRGMEADRAIDRRSAPRGPQQSLR